MQKKGPQMSKKKKLLLIVLAVVLVAGGICWRILPDRLTSGTLKLSEDISLTHRLEAGKRWYLTWSVCCAAVCLR